MTKFNKRTGRNKRTGLNFPHCNPIFTKFSLCQNLASNYVIKVFFIENTFFHKCIIASINFL